MRILVLLLLLFAMPVQAQERIFRASSVDLKQNERIDSLEARVTALEAKKIAIDLPSLPVKPTSPPPRHVLQAHALYETPVPQQSQDQTTEKWIVPVQPQVQYQYSQSYSHATSQPVRRVPTLRKVFK